MADATPNVGNATPALPTHPETMRISARLVKIARDRLNNVPRNEITPDTQVAAAAGVSRNTVRKFRTEARDDASLSLWMAAMLESNGDPVQTLADALEDDND